MLPAALQGSCAWLCHGEECDHSHGGSIIDFEVAMYAKLYTKITGTSSAWKRVVTVIRGVRRDQEATRRALDAAMKDMSEDD